MGTAKNVIFVLMTGAPAHIDTFDLKVGPWTPAFMAPMTYSGMAFPQGLMPNLANTIGDIALVRSIRAHATAHSLAQTWVQIGRNPDPGIEHHRAAYRIGCVVGAGRSGGDDAPVHFAECVKWSGQRISAARRCCRFYVSPGGGGAGEYVASGRANRLQSPLRPDDEAGCRHIGE